MLPTAREECTSSVMIGGVAKLEPKLLTRLTTNQGTCQPWLLLSWTSVLSDPLQGSAPPWSSASACFLRPPAPTFSLAQKRTQRAKEGGNPPGSRPLRLCRPLTARHLSVCPEKTFFQRSVARFFPLFSQSFHIFWLLSLTTSLFVSSVSGFHLTLPSLLLLILFLTRLPQLRVQSWMRHNFPFFPSPCLNPYLALLVRFGVILR